MTHNVNVWKDAWGNYRAEVDVEEGDTTSEVQLNTIARKAIREAYGEEIGKNYILKLAYLGMMQRRDGSLVCCYGEQ